MSILGFVILFFALIVIAAAQTALALGLMYGMHKWFREKLTETKYVAFDFDNFQKLAFQEMMARLALIYLVPTMLFHLLIYACVSWYYFVYHRWLLCFILLLLETGVVGMGLFYLLKLDRFRLVVLIGGSAFFYLLLIWYMTGGNLFKG